jgi:pimeloyl-ACP methyl ester carboxylesterase
MSRQSEALRRAAPLPSLASISREVTGLLELPRLLLQSGLLRDGPPGDGHTVFVLPGFAADGRSTSLLRAYLRRLGHHVRDWGLGRNVADVERTVERMRDRVLEARRRSGAKVSLVGWSLGGYIAREVARDEAEAVRAVVTFGSPVIGGPRYTAAAAMADRQGWDLEAIEAAIAARKRVPLRVPVTALYSRRDGVVDWRACIDDENGGPITHVEVDATHLGLGFSPEVFRIVAERLAD